MKTIEHENLVAKVNHLARQVAPREGELDRPLTWSNERAIWEGFFINYDDGRSLLHALLRDNGFTDHFYEASYHWCMRSEPFTIGSELGHYLKIEYVEGDLYATPV